jgi:hypothetical protein
MSPVSEIVFWKFKKLWPTHCCPLLAKETVLGPMSLKERGDRRRPRTAKLVQFAVTSNCASTKRLGARSLLDFRSACTKSRFVGLRCSRPAYPRHIAQELQTRSRVGQRILAICVISTSLSSDRSVGTGLSTTAR